MLDGFNSDSVSRVYPHTLFCNSFIKNQCVSKFGNKIFYDDDDHFNAIGAEMVSELILHEIERWINETSVSFSSSGNELEE